MLRRLHVFGHSTNSQPRMNWQWHYSGENLSSKGKYIWHFSRYKYKPEAFLKNDSSQNSSLGPVINNLVLAGTMIRLLVTVGLLVSYFYDFHYFSCRRHCFCWHSRVMTEVQNTGSKFLYLQVLILNRMVWQKQREEKTKTAHPVLAGAALGLVCSQGVSVWPHVYYS